MLSFYQNDFYHPSICDLCKTIINLKICAKCKSVSYCSKIHQIVSWPSHKKLCKIISDTDKKLSELEDKILGDEYFCRVKSMWIKKLKRDTTDKEDSIIKYRMTCIVCASSNATIGCDKCLSIFYCSTNHKERHANKHAEYCALIKCNFDLMLYLYETAHPPIPLLTGKEIHLGSLHMNLIKLFQYLENKSYLILYKLCPLENLVVIDYFAPIATILFALEKSSLLKNQTYMRKEIVVHIVGVDTEERSWYWCLLLEFAFHWIKNLEHLTFIAVGPNAGSWNYSLKNMTSVCGFCEMNTSNIKLFSSPNYYHEVVNELEKPDVVVAFNCGLFKMLSWRQTIPYLTKYQGIPLVLTDYTLEYLGKDIEEMENFSEKEIEIVLKPQLNPFSGVSPKRHDFWDLPICYSNKYIAILKSK